MTVCVHPPPPFPVHSFLRPRFRPLSPSFHLQSTANIYLVVYPGSMQSWMSATHEFFCSESMVSRMYSPPCSTCGSSRKLQSYTELCSVHHVKAKKRKLHQKTGEVERDFSKAMVYLICIPDVLYVGFFSVIDVKQEVVVHKYLCISYLENKRVVLVRHLQRHGGPHLHNG